MKWFKPAYVMRIGPFKSFKEPVLSPIEGFNHCVPFKAFTKPVADVAPLRRRVGHLFQREEMDGAC